MIEGHQIDALGPSGINALGPTAFDEDEARNRDLVREMAAALAEAAEVMLDLQMHATHILLYMCLRTSCTTCGVSSACPPTDWL